MPRRRSFTQHKCAGKRLVAGHGLGSETPIAVSIEPLRLPLLFAPTYVRYRARWDICFISSSLLRTLCSEFLM